MSLIYSVAPSLPWTEHNGPVLCIGLVVGFFVDQEAHSLPGSLADEETLWQMIGECLPEGDILDEGVPKPCSEFLAYGSCHASSPVKSMECSVQVGSALKRLVAVGDRFSQDGFVSEPKPFACMNISRSNAYGGPGHPFNPQGKGHSASGLPFRALPNILDPYAPSGQEDSEALPAGFGPLPVHWPARRAHLGPLDDGWLRDEWPGLPEGTRQEYACRAPAGQRMSGFFKGGEPIVMQGLHASEASVQGVLPLVRGRIFVAPAQSCGTKPHEVPCVMETLHLFPGRRFGVLVLRGSVPVDDEECEDVAGIMAVLEDATLPAADAREHLLVLEQAMVGEEREAETPGGDQAMQPPSRPEASERTRPTTQGKAAAMADEDSGDASFAALRKQVEELEQEAGKILKDSGRKPSEADALLARSTARVNPDTAERASLDGLRKSVERLQKEAADHAGSGLAGPDPVARFGDCARHAMHEVAARPPAMPGELEKHRQVLAKVEAALSGLATMASAIVEPDGVEDGRDSSNPNESPDAPPSTGPPLSTEQAKAILAAGGSLAHRDLTLCDLSGMNLPGVDLKGALLSEVTWNNTNLSGADMRGIIADHATFHECILDRANLEGADLEYSRLAGCSLKECAAGQVQFQNADLSGCDLSFSVMTSADLSGALLGGAKCVGICGQRIRLQDADVRRACFQGADLSESRADAGTMGAGADFSRALCRGACWSGASLPGACLRDAVLDDADLSACDLREAVLEFAQARRVTLDKAILRRADLTGCNLFQASLRRSDLSESTIRHANLFGADLHKCNVRGATMFEVNLGRTTLDRHVEEGASG